MLRLCITCSSSNTEITGAGQILKTNLAFYFFTCENIPLTHIRYRGELWLSGRVLVSGVERFRVRASP